MFKDIFVKILQEQNITAYKLSKDTGITQMKKPANTCIFKFTRC